MINGARQELTTDRLLKENFDRNSNGFEMVGPMLNDGVKALDETVKIKSVRVREDGGSKVIVRIVAILRPRRAPPLYPSRAGAGLVSAALEVLGTGPTACRRCLPFRWADVELCIPSRAAAALNCMAWPSGSGRFNDSGSDSPGLGLGRSSSCQCHGPAGTQ